MKLLLAHFLKSVPEGTTLPKPLPPHMTIVPPVDHTHSPAWVIDLHGSLRGVLGSSAPPIHLKSRTISLLGPDNNIPALLIDDSGSYLSYIRYRLADIVGFSFDQARAQGYSLPFHVTLVNDRPCSVNRYMRHISLLVKHPGSDRYVVEKNFKLGSG